MTDTDFKDWEKDLDQIFEDLGEAGTEYASADDASPGLIESLYEEEGRLDPWRRRVVEFLGELGRFFTTAAKEPEKVPEAAAMVAQALYGLDGMPNHDGRLVVRYRGRLLGGDDEVSRELDYLVSFGPVTLDMQRIRLAARRLGKDGEGLEKTFSDSCSLLAKAGINTLYASCCNTANQPRLETCLDALAAYLSYMAADEDERDPDAGPYPIIHDEARRPSANLTLLAAVNGMSRGPVQVLVNQVQTMMTRAGARDPLLRYTCVYDAVFAFRKLWGVLVRPPLEVNNLRWLVADTRKEGMNERLAGLVRLVGGEFGPDNRKSPRILDALCAGDYGFIPPEELCERMGVLSELIDALTIRAASPSTSVGQADHVDENTISEILDLIRSRLARVPDQVWEKLVPGSTTLSCVTAGGKKITRHVDARLMDLNLFYRRRAAVNKKMKSLLAGKATFGLEDFEVVASDFGISVEDAADLVDLLQSCFDEKGHFLRPAFEKNIPAFCRHERDVFGFLWHYLKEHMDTGDRLALLNALQLLINRMRNPNRALEALLTGMLANPETVSFADRNALILANVLVRKFNKELLKDTKMTPEEVLHVVDGLDGMAVAHVRDILEEEKEKVFLKVRTVHGMLKNAMDPYAWHTSLPLGYLLTLEREIYILMALVGGPVARSVLFSALWEYGNPESSVYKLAEREDQVMWIFHLLQVVIRGLGRVGEPQDAQVLLGLKSHAAAFSEKSTDPKAADQVKRFLAWADKSARALTGGDPVPGN
ncbi:MAG: hypothetical protein JRI97_07085 [Deltaproteobacteria bacterium]|nr:hypothetical protein [Deltaproteobacteria bacterium]